MTLIGLNRGENWISEVRRYFMYWTNNLLGNKTMWMLSFDTKLLPLTLRLLSLFLTTICCCQIICCLFRRLATGHFILMDWISTLRPTCVSLFLNQLEINPYLVYFWPKLSISMTDTGEFLNRIALFYAVTGSSRLMIRFLVWLVI